MGFYGDSVDLFTRLLISLSLSPSLFPTHYLLVCFALVRLGARAHSHRIGYAWDSMEIRIAFVTAAVAAAVVIAAAAPAVTGCIAN